MKPASTALIALLNSSEQFIMADLYTFTLVGGSILRYSAAPTALTVNGQAFALGPKFERSKTKVVIGVQVDELEVKVYPEPTDLIGDLPSWKRRGKVSSTLCCSSNEPLCRPMVTLVLEPWFCSPAGSRTSIAAVPVST